MILDPVEEFWASYTKPEQSRRLGRTALGGHADGTGRASMAAFVSGRLRSTIDLTDTTTGAIHEALTQARRRMGGPASGMVLTLIIVTDEAAQYDAVRAADQGTRAPEQGAGRHHPQAQGRVRLDAEIRVGETGPGETILLRMYGPLGQHADSVVAPLLAPDVPVVTWWPDEAPPSPSADALGTRSPSGA